MKGVEETAELVSQRAYAKRRGVTHRAVQKAILSGRIQKNRKGLIDAKKADEDWMRNTAPRPAQQQQRPPDAAAARNGKKKSTKPGLAPAAPPAPTAVDGYASHRATREYYLASMARLDYEERNGDLVRMSDIERIAFNKYRTIRDGMLNIPERVAALVAAETSPRKCHDILTTEIRKALFESAGDPKC